jgi:hypothetical protein
MLTNSKQWTMRDEWMDDESMQPSALATPFSQEFPPSSRGLTLALKPWRIFSLLFDRFYQKVQSPSLGFGGHCT